MKRYFLTGLVILLPLAFTVAIFTFCLHFLTKPFIGMVSHFLENFQIFPDGFLFLSRQQVVRYSSEMLILLLLFCFTWTLGLIARWFFFKSFLALSDRLLHRIPLINKVYKTTQEIIKTLFVTDKTSFKRVVMVPFPKQGSYVLGLVSRQAPRQCCDAAGSSLISVLVPTTPNPTTGFLLMYAESELVDVDMKPEEAIKYVVSCGVITPDQQNQQPLLPKSETKNS
ncbi:MAG: DUF502 domain-containing protein [Chlamydiota bacterium]|nr:DUF502 domain-containing protein [Chlamydiota bacterium]